MDAQAELDLVGRKLETRPARRRHRARRERDAHRADRSRRVRRRRPDLGQRAAGCGHRAGDLVHQHRAGQTAPTGMVSLCGERDVVGHHHHLDRPTLGAGDLGGQAEVEPVTGVVLDDQQHAAGPSHRVDRGEHGIGRRRAEDIAHHRRSQHARPDVARVRGLVASAAARDQRHLTASLDRLDVGAQRKLLAGQQRDLRVGHRQTGQHLRHDLLDFVDQFFHHGFLCPALATAETTPSG